jgi:LAGLIDADG endonuclease
MLGVGQVVVSADGMAEYRLRDLNSILLHIIPLFDKHLLLTSKYYNFKLFKQAALVKNNATLSTEQKNNLLFDLKRKIRPDNYISPA